MPIALALAVIFGAEPRPSVAALGFSGSELPHETLEFFAEHFASRLAESKALKVTTQKDLAGLIALQKQKELLGCDEAVANCMAEIGEALGADVIASGQLARVEKSYQLNVKLQDSATREVFFVYSSPLLSGQEQIVNRLNEVAAKAEEEILARRPQPAKIAGGIEQEARPTPLWGSVIPAAFGVVALGIGVGFWHDTRVRYESLSNRSSWSSLDSERFNAEAAAGGRNQSVAIALTVVGTCALLAALGWFLIERG